MFTETAALFLGVCLAVACRLSYKACPSVQEMPVSESNKGTRQTASEKLVLYRGYCHLCFVKGSFIA